MPVHEISQVTVDGRIRAIVAKIIKNEEKPSLLIGISRGGIIPAMMVAEDLRAWAGELPVKVVDPFTCEWFKDIPQDSKHPIVFIDDIEDSCVTLDYFRNECFKRSINAQYYSIVKKTENEKAEGIWYKFPWETSEDTEGGMKQAVVALLRGMGEDPKREGLRDTPRRVAQMWAELTSGYKSDPAKILSTTFSKESYDEMIVVKDIKFFSTCEHHLAPFYGIAHFAYIPNSCVVGLSKVHRLVEMFARRLQIQERMTIEIGTTFEKIVKPKGVAVVIEATHLCTMMRGVKKENSKMVTSYLGGVFRAELPTRQEFLSIVKEK